MSDTKPTNTIHKRQMENIISEEDLEYQRIWDEDNPKDLSLRPNTLDLPSIADYHNPTGYRRYSTFLPGKKNSMREFG